jgi:hypothetical protein
MFGNFSFGVKPSFTFFGVCSELQEFPSMTMGSIGDLAIAVAVADTDERHFRQVKPHEMQVIFVAISSILVNGKKKHGKFFELAW